MVERRHHQVVAARVWIQRQAGAVHETANDVELLCNHARLSLEAFGGGEPALAHRLRQLRPVFLNCAHTRGQHCVAKALGRIKLLL